MSGTTQVLLVKQQSSEAYYALKRILVPVGNKEAQAVLDWEVKINVRCPPLHCLTVLSAPLLVGRSCHFA